MYHDQDVLEVGLFLEVEDVLTVEVESVNEVDLGGQVGIERHYAADPVVFLPHAGEVDFLRN